MATTIEIQNSHLGTVKVGYRISNGRIDPAKPTVVCINSMCMTSALYEPQFNDQRVTDVANILAVEPLGHGATSFPPKAAHFTYWDSAVLALQVMDALDVQKAFTLGTSQGGWIVMRMALLAPERILGVLPLGTSMDAETAETRTLGCWDPVPILKPFSDAWTSAAATPDWVVDDTWCGMVGSFGFGNHATPELTQKWFQILKETYSGDEGRKKARMAVLCLLGRDSLILRLPDVTCPVYWLQGTEDAPYGSKAPEEHIQLFTSAKEKKLVMVEGGAHYLNATNAKEVNDAIVEMVTKHS